MVQAHSECGRGAHVTSIHHVTDLNKTNRTRPPEMVGVTAMLYQTLGTLSPYQSRLLVVCYDMLCDDHEFTFVFASAFSMSSSSSPGCD
jgi:hypothetical protein